MMTKYSIKSCVLAFCGATLLTIANGAPASAVVIFSDHFNRPASNTVGNNWVEKQSNANDVAVTNWGRLRLRDNNGFPDAQASQLSLSTLGYENISISFRYRGLNTEAHDILRILYAADSGFSTAAIFTLENHGWTTVNFLALAADNANLFRFRLRTNVSEGAIGNNEGALIDNVVVRGDLIPVSEPGTAALFGLGLAGLGYARRRKFS